MGSPGRIRRITAAAGRLVRPNRRAVPAGGATDGLEIDGVAIQYAPDLDGDPAPGEVVWAWVPYEDDADQGKDRPVLILGRDGEVFAGVPLTSKDPGHRRDADTRVPVGTGGWDRDRRPSWADAERLLRFAPSEIRREGSTIDRARFDQVVARVRQLHDT